MKLTHLFKSCAALAVIAAFSTGCETQKNLSRTYSFPFNPKVTGLSAGDKFNPSALYAGDALGMRVFVEEIPATARRWTLSDIAAAEVPTE